MALKFINFIDRCDSYIRSCENVSLCLIDSWKVKTLDGTGIISGRVVTVNPYIEPNTTTNCCHQAPLCPTECIFQLEINDNQFAIDPDTSLPYVITADALSEILPYPCHISKLISYIATTTDHYLNVDNMVVVSNAVDNRHQVTMQVISSVDNSVLDSGTFNINGGALTLPVAGTIRYTSGPGKVHDVNACSATSSCFDGVTLIQNPLNFNKWEVNCPALPGPTFANLATAPSGAGVKQYSNGGDLIYQGPKTFSAFNRCETVNPNSKFLVTDVVIGPDNAWSFDKMPEHFEIAEVFTIDNALYANSTAVNTLKTGNSNVKSPAYVEITYANPMLCRDLRVLITASASFAADNVVGSGIVIWGHSLWVNGTLIANKNGRSLAGYNVSQSVHEAALEDFILPNIQHAITIPKGGTVTIGVDFGDNDVFPTVGTTNFLQIESRQISIVGGTI